MDGNCPMSSNFQNIGIKIGRFHGNRRVPNAEFVLSRKQRHVSQLEASRRFLHVKGGDPGLTCHGSKRILRNLFRPLTRHSSSSRCELLNLGHFLSQHGRNPFPFIRPFIQSNLARMRLQGETRRPFLFTPVFPEGSGQERGPSS